MGNRRTRFDLYSTGIIFIILAAVTLLAAGSGAGQEFRPDKDYIPNDFEKTLIDRIKTAAKPDTSAMKFNFRMSPAIENACKGLYTVTPKTIDSVLDYAGGHHKVISRETITKLQTDPSVIEEVMTVIPPQGHFAVKTIESPNGAYLVVYWSDIAHKWLPAKGGLGYGEAIYPADLDFFRIGLSAMVDSDSMKYILYRGVSSLIIPTDSIVKAVFFATIHDSFDVSIEFEKKRFDIWSVNLYCLNRVSGKYDLIAIAIPACIVDRPPRPKK
jgi:hypothetical protein